MHQALKQMLVKEDGRRSFLVIFPTVISRQREEGGKDGEKTVLFYFIFFKGKKSTVQKWQDTEVQPCLKRVHHGKILSDTHVEGG